MKKVVLRVRVEACRRGTIDSSRGVREVIDTRRGGARVLVHEALPLTPAYVHEALHILDEGRLQEKRDVSARGEQGEKEASRCPQ